MKFFFVLLITALAVDARSNSFSLNPTDVKGIKDCVEDVLHLFQSIVNEITETFQHLLYVIDETNNNVAKCREGIDNPSLAEQIQIARCLYGVYFEFRHELFDSIFAIQRSLHRVAELPNILKECIPTQ